ncbi:DUF4383 domain-containing protein [Kribbella turkmenica]|uniref:DUF4383 domain-containing protein n=1 Tax=Kribbella turkmenica TaxID=2530375 RepID=UPI0014052D01|nr:DUF4383 domain-containing protein [Kribbella turkmenica]
MDDASRYPSPPTGTQAIALWIAGGLLVLSCFGFLLRLGQNVRSLDLGGVGTETVLFGLFHVSVLHNVVHLLLGAAALATAGNARHCRRFLAVTGAALLALVLYGQLDRTPIVADLVPVGTADTWLHLLLALTMIVAAGHGAATRAGWRGRRSAE